MHHAPIAAGLALLLLTAPAGAQQRVVAVLAEAGDTDRGPTPASIVLPVPEAFAQSGTVLLRGAGGVTLVGQLTAPGLLSGVEATTRDGRPVRELHFLTPALDQGESIRLEVSPAEPRSLAVPSFSWSETPEGDLLRLAETPVMLYVRPELDESSPEAREETFKPFHHLYAPDGTRVTKGPGGKFTHHRGLFFGFNRVRYGDGKTADVWHCRGDAFQSHEGTVSSEAGPVLGRHRARIDWHGQEGEVFARETREVTAFATPGGHLYEFASRVETTGGPVELDGDPQHAGVHVRASNEVADETAGQTYYLRPDGPGEPGQTRNWDPKTGEGPVNLPWNAMSFVLGGTRYTAVYLDHPENPKEARYSERDYGRFGSYFEATVTEDRPLEVRYRVWLEQGELTVGEAFALDTNFDKPVSVRVVD